MPEPACAYAGDVVKAAERPRRPAIYAMIANAAAHRSHGWSPEHFSAAAALVDLRLSYQWVLTLRYDTFMPSC